MLKFLLDKFKQTPGPLKQTRLVVGDLAEEFLDLAEHYVKRLKGTDSPIPSWDIPSCSQMENTQSVKSPVKSSFAAQAPPPEAKSTVEKSGPERVLEVPDNLAGALDVAQNKKKQEFKVLAILWDANRNNLGPMSAKGVSAHGRKLGLSIRHENVRKVIRMRLDKYVEIRTEEMGSGTTYRYNITEEGEKYFSSKYFNS